jgi:hypothetical protein
MSQFDETQLSAYLDGELDPESSRRVEEAMRADPGLARTLRDLSQVSGLVAGLRRPPESEAPDVSGAVVDRVDRSRARRRAYPSFAAASSLAAAAVLVISILRGWNPPPVVDRDAQVVGLGPGGPAETAVTPPIPPAVIEVAGATEIPGPPGPTPAPEIIEAPETALAEASSPADPELVRFVGDLATRPGSMALTIEAPPGIGVEALFEDVDDLLRHTVRGDLRYGVIRPEHSGGVGVFALIAAPDERRKLLRRLGDNLEGGARMFEPTAGPSPGALLDGAVGLGLELLAAERTAPLREVDADGHLIANRQHPDDGLAIPPAPQVPPPLIGGLGPPHVVIPAPPRPDPKAGAVPEAEEEAGAVFLFIRGDGPRGD